MYMYNFEYTMPSSRLTSFCVILELNIKNKKINGILKRTF